MATGVTSDLAQVDAHVIAPHEYEELPELTDEMMSRAVRIVGGRPRSANPRVLISLRLPAAVVARWRATGLGVANADGGAVAAGVGGDIAEPLKRNHRH